MIDSHCHLDHEPMYSDLTNVINRSKNIGIEKILSICTTIDSFKKIKKIVNFDPIIYGTFGIHPHECANNYVSKEDIIRAVKQNNKIVAIGESGLDFYYNHSDKDIQKSLFIKHIRSCQETSKPLIVHSRNAEKETLEILTSEKKNRNFDVLMHCFTGSKNFAHNLLDIDCYFSASGVITFKKSAELANTFRSIPNNKILVETDSPYLSPEPLRGKVNEPCNIIHTVKFISILKKLTQEDVENFTTSNFTNLFKINI